MAAELFDVWLVESNAVYRGVPYDVVADWAQQGRVTAADMLRPAQSEDWGRVDESPLRPYLPGVQAELVPTPPPVDDRAEALAPVEFEFTYRRKRADEDDDVDMIPLIDISLVLLVFFMMTASTATMSSPVPVPEVTHGAELAVSPKLRIDLTPTSDGMTFAVAYGGNAIEPENAQLTREQLLAKIDEQMKTSNEALIIHVAAHKDAPFLAVRELVEELEKRKKPKQGYGIQSIFAEVSEKRP